MKDDELKPVDPVEKDKDLEVDLLEKNDINPKQPITTVITDSGDIQIVHTITLGDMLISTLLLALITFVVISRVVRRV